MDMPAVGLCNNSLLRLGILLVSMGKQFKAHMGKQQLHLGKQQLDLDNHQVGLGKHNMFLGNHNLC